VDETAQFQSDLPAVLAQAVEVRAEQPGLLLLGTEQRLGPQGKGRQRRSLFGNRQGDVGSGTLLGKERAPQRAPEKSAEQFGPALMCRRLTGLPSLLSPAALSRRADIERVEAETEPRAEPQRRGTRCGRERPVLTFGIKNPAVAPENSLPPDEGLLNTNRCFGYLATGALQGLLQGAHPNQARHYFGHSQPPSLPMKS
jgi:hypothetical protein